MPNTRVEVAAFAGDHIVLTTDATVDVYYGSELMDRGLRATAIRNPEPSPHLGTKNIDIFHANTCNPVTVARAAWGLVNTGLTSPFPGEMFVKHLRELPEVPPDLIRYVGYTGTDGQATSRAIGYQWTRWITKYAYLTPSSQVLDIGCGWGRIGFYLAPLLMGGGQYIGCDTSTAAIGWATERLCPLVPTLSFKALPSPLQRRRGGYMAEYAAPIDQPPGSIDLVIATSLFTHLRYEAARNYMEQISAILKPGGRALLTCFIGSRSSDYLKRVAPIEDQHGRYTIDDTYADSYFEPDALLGALHASGLRVLRVINGGWRRRDPENTSPIGDTPQDTIICEKA